MELLYLLSFSFLLSLLLFIKAFLHIDQKTNNFWIFFSIIYIFFRKYIYTKKKPKTTFNGGSLGSCIDEERSKLRYVVWIAEFSESSKLWTQMSLSGIPGSMPVWGSVNYTLLWLFFYIFLNIKKSERQDMKDSTLVVLLNIEKCFFILLFFFFFLFF